MFDKKGMNTMKRTVRSVAVLTTASVAMLGLAACGGSSSSATSGNGDTSASGGGSGKSITIGYIPWDEDIAVTNTWKKVLEDKGYNVTMKQLDVAPTFVGLAQGDIDLFFDAWLPNTHADYWAKYGSKIDDVGVWYDNAKLTIAVPDYVDVQSLSDLKGKANEFNGQIIGIEPGAGLTRITKDKMMPAYGLNDSYKLVTSSTSAMLASLKKAVDAKKPIVVTLWRPHWAYAAFPIRDLKDPKGAMGKAEKIHTLARKGFAQDFPQVTSMLKNFTMDDQQLGSLENLVLQQNKDNPQAGVDAWLKDNQDWLSSLGG